MDVLDIIGKFQLLNLPQDWVDSQWHQDFSSDKELPSEYAFALEDEDFGDLLNALCESLKEWLTSEDPSLNATSSSGQLDTSSLPHRPSWQSLVNSEFNHKSLIAVVSSFLKADFKQLTDDVSRRRALAASRVYFLLLAIKGAQIYNVYNSILFAQALESLKVLNLLGDVQEKTKPGKQKGRKKRNTQEETEEPEDTDVAHISNAEKAELIKTLIEALKDLLFCLSIFSLKDEEDTFNRTIGALVSIARLEKSVPTFVEHASRSASITYLSHRAYKAMLELCHESHGDVEELVRFICRSLLPHLVMSAQEVHTNDKSKSIVRAHMIAFIKLMIETLGEKSYKGVQALTQQLCIRTPEKADIRARCVQQLLTLLSYFPLDLFTKCTLWICSFTFSDAVKNRVMGVEILTKLLHSDEKQGEITETIVPSRKPTGERSRSPSLHGDDSSSDRDEEDQVEPEPVPPAEPDILVNGTSTTLFVSHKFFLSALLSRMVDQSPTVRAKCLSSVASLILLKTQVINDIMLGIFVSPYKHIEGPVDGAFEEDRPDFDFRLFFLRKHKEPPNRNPLPGGSRLVDRIQKLAKDQKVFVRKSSLNVLCNILRLSNKWITPGRLDILVASCLDFSVTVRKMMIQCLTDLLLDYPSNESLIKAWVQGVVPLVADNELKCQEKAIEAVSTIVLDRLVPHDLMASYPNLLPWKVIKLLNLFEMRKIFRFVCRHWIITKRIGIKEMKILSTHIGTENDLGAWYFIVCISEFTDFHNPDQILHYYLDNIYDKPIVREYCSQLVLDALFLNWRHIDPALMTDLVETKLLPSLEKCVLPLTSITPIMDICIQYNEETFLEVAKRIISKCELHLKQNIGPNSPQKCLREDALIQHIFTLGDATSVCPKCLPYDSIGLLCNLIDPDFFDTDKKLWKGKVGSVCQAVTITTLGKFCLQDQLLAKKLVPLLGTLLDTVTPTEVKLNTLTTMSDLCIRFTSIVEPYLGDMCVCLKDPDVRVRKTTLNLLIRLIQNWFFLPKAKFSLQVSPVATFNPPVILSSLDVNIKEDYIKLKCPYIYYVLQMLEDPELHIRTTTKSFIINTVIPKNPRIMVQEFIQALYFLNDYEVYDAVGLAFSRVSMNPNEKKIFAISGSANQQRRRNLLSFMVDNMVDDHKFKILNSICSEIFDGVSDEKILLDNRGTPVVQDAIFILGCEELRMSMTKNKGDDDEDDTNAGERVDNKVASIVDAFLKQVFQENVMPSVIKFKRKLQSVKSTLVRELMIALRTMMKEFKDWMQEVLNSDATLASEIELDMRLLGEEEAEEPSSQEGGEFPNLPKLLNDSEKLTKPGVSLPRTSNEGEAIDAALPGPSQSGRANNVVEASATPPPVGSVVSDDDLSSLSTPSTSSQASGKGSKRQKESPLSTKPPSLSAGNVSPMPSTSQYVSKTSGKSSRRKKTQSSDSPSDASTSPRGAGISSPPRKKISGRLSTESPTPTTSKSARRKKTESSDSPSDAPATPRSTESSSPPRKKTKKKKQLTSSPPVQVKSEKSRKPKNR